MVNLRKATVVVLLAAAGAVVGVWALRLACAPRHGRPEASLLPDDVGKITHVTCLVNSARRAALRNAELVTHIVNALPKRVYVTIMTNDLPAFIVASNPDPQRVEFLELPAESDFTVWPQDPFVVLERRHGPNLILASATFQRVDDRIAARRLADGLGWDYRTGELAFEGGNIVSGSRHVFVGSQTVRFNSLKLGISQADVVRRFQRRFGRRILVVGPFPQPVGHIDMILTPLDSGRLALADAGWGAELARRQLEESPKAVEDFERWCERYYFGRPDIREVTDVEGKTITAPQVVGRTAAAVKAAEEIAKDLDELAGHLGRWGYKVERLPFLCPPRPGTTSAARTSARTRPATSPASRPESRPTPIRADYPTITYNNVLTERFSGRRIVYLPQYGWKAFDDAAAGVWEKLGYEVVRVEGFAISAMYGGSLRCCVKVLQRTAEDDEPRPQGSGPGRKQNRLSQTIPGGE